jgi:4-amino-4-deoxy-L-arabinose transferase-like glycosyltransferase
MSARPWWVLLALAAAVYTLGLGGQYIPTNGDELVYAHIARVTAASGHWLPLASELDNMRNTKPPLLFWQAMVAGGWAHSAGDWTLLALRLPSLLYTALISALIGVCTLRISRSPTSALIAVCVYLSFFCSFRYGRPYLTSAPETFWLDLPLFALLRWRSGTASPPSPTRAVDASNRPPARIKHTHIAIKYVAVVMLTGLAWGLGLAYKSFALIAPAAAALWCAWLASEPGLTWRRTVTVSASLLASALLALGIFALWFVLDPDPAAVWQEFVIGENAGKMTDKKGYWHEALHGGDSSLWAQALAYVQNAGLLAPLVLGLAWAGCKRLLASPPLPAAQKILLAWLAVWLLVFSVPSQRSARYVIAAMPAAAMVLALAWERIPRGWFLASYGLTGIATLALTRIAWVAHDLGIATRTELAAVLMFAGAGALATLGGVFSARFSRAGVVAACLCVYACFNLTVAPLDGPAGRYGSAVAARFSQARIAIPSNFRAQYERFEFLLPGNRLLPFDMALLNEGDAATPKLMQLLATHDAVVWWPADPAQTEPACAPQCEVVAQRWVVKERHKEGDVTLANLWQPHRWLFTREWILVKG